MYRRRASGPGFDSRRLHQVGIFRRCRRDLDSGRARALSSALCASRRRARLASSKTARLGAHVCTACIWVYGEWRVVHWGVGGFGWGGVPRVEGCWAGHMRLVGEGAFRTSGDYVGGGYVRHPAGAIDAPEGWAPIAGWRRATLRPTRKSTSSSLCTRGAPLSERRAADIDLVPQRGEECTARVGKALRGTRTETKRRKGRRSP